MNDELEGISSYLYYAHYYYRDINLYLLLANHNAIHFQGNKCVPLIFFFEITKKSAKISSFPKKKKWWEKSGKGV